MTRFLDKARVELPVVQAGMGGGLARHELAAAVSEAGGLGTIGFLDPDELEREIAAARERTSRPVAANLLLPFARRAHWRAASHADVVVTFWGRPRRRTSAAWIHQCGSVAEARAAHRAGADAVIVQGVEAGGHVRGSEPALELLERAKRALPGGYPVLLAGGMAEATDVRRALDAGADAAVLGTRFLMTEESGAHPVYKERLAGARETVITELFSMGWFGRTRVAWNQATERWLSQERPLGPPAVLALNRLTARALARVPAALQQRFAAMQRPHRPFFGPMAPTRDGPSNLLDAGPLYAGESVARIGDVRPAGELTRELAGAGAAF